MSERTPYARLQKLLGRTPDALQVQRMEHLRELFSLRADDSLWSLFLLFEYMRSAPPAPESRRAISSPSLPLLVAVAAASVWVGSRMQGTASPLWAPQGPSSSEALSVLHALLYAPVGWVLPLLFAPTSLGAFRRALRRLRAEHLPGRDKAGALALALGLGVTHLGYATLLLALAWRT